ncbi:MAG TPA: hypothetical protein VME67_26600 [Mycobacterium sp.]|nr:hypothetical protein [Mycobacterium sp.]HTX98085.1 hypothetical protein [Mycobacterium sp.]
MALKAWLEKAEPDLLNEIFLDLDVDIGIPASARWLEALKKTNDRCEAVSAWFRRTATILMDV